MTQQAEQVYQELAAEFEIIKPEFDEILQGFLDLKLRIEEMVKQIVKVINQTEGLPNSVKREVALKLVEERVTPFLDDLIKLPFYLEPLDGPAINLVLARLVDAALKVGGATP